MTTQTLLDELDRLLMQPDRLITTMPAWRDQVEAALPELSEDEANTLLTEARRRLNENRALFENESRSLLDTLIDVHGGRKPSEKKVNQYRDIDRLDNKPKGQPR